MLVYNKNLRNIVNLGRFMSWVIGLIWTWLDTVFLKCPLLFCFLPSASHFSRDSALFWNQWCTLEKQKSHHVYKNFALNWNHSAVAQQAATEGWICFQKFDFRNRCSGILEADLSELIDLSPLDATAWAADEKRLVGVIANKSFFRWFVIFLVLFVLATVGRKANIIQ